MMCSNSQNSGQDPEVVVLFCQRSLCDEERLCALSQQTSGFSLRTKMMPCSSKVEVPYILRILESGADAVEIVACPEKSCQYLVGSLRAEKRVEYIRGLLKKIGYASERVGITRKILQTPEELIKLAEIRADEVRPLGINPMKKGVSH